MQLKINRAYVNRQGEINTIVEYNKSKGRYIDQDGRSYSADGKFQHRRAGRLDLICMWPHANSAG